MRFFWNRPKKIIETSNRSVVNSLGIDLTQYPDDSFYLNKIDSQKDRVVFGKLSFENKFFGIFSELTINDFKDPGRSYVFKCEPYEFNKFDLPDFIDKIYAVYGNDDYNKGKFTGNDSTEIDEGFWMGRTWLDDKYPDPCMISYSEKDGLSFIILSKLESNDNWLKHNLENKPKKIKNDTFTVTVEIPSIQNAASDFVAIDIETAQGPRWSICQLGIVIVEQGEIKKSICHFVQPPENKYHPGNINVHKITPDKTVNAPVFPRIWDEVKPMLEDKLIVAHNSEFDISCLEHALNYYQLEVPEFRHDCTYRRSGMALIDACAAYGIDLSNHHDAECDARACANIYLKLISGYEPNMSLNPHPKAKNHFDFTGHEKIQGDLLKPDLDNADKSNPFYGKKVVFTGVLNCIDRNVAAVSVKNMGADIDTGITKRTNLVIVGENPGYAKIGKIEKYNSEGSDIKIVYESEFLKMLN